jgi:hypothetical protein
MFLVIAVAMSIDMRSPVTLNLTNTIIGDTNFTGSESAHYISSLRPFCQHGSGAVADGSNVADANGSNATALVQLGVMNTSLDPKFEGRSEDWLAWKFCVANWMVELDVKHDEELPIIESPCTALLDRSEGSESADESVHAGLGESPARQGAEALAECRKAQRL